MIDKTAELKRRVAKMEADFEAQERRIAELIEPVNTREFLISLFNPGRVTKRELRQHARNLLRHYPTDLDMERPAVAFGKSVKVPLRLSSDALHNRDRK